MAIALTRTMQRGHTQIKISRQSKRQMKNMKKMKNMSLGQKSLGQKRAVIKTSKISQVMTHMQKMMMMMNMKALHSYIAMWYVLHKTRQVSQETGSY